MKIISIIFIAASIYSVSSFASASNSELVDTIPVGKIYIHASSIYNGPQGKSGDKRKVRTLISFDVKQKNISGEKFYSMEFFDELSYAKQVRTTYASIQYVGELGTGKVVKTHKMNFLTPEPIKTGSFDQLVLGEANCNLITGKWGNAQ